MLSRPITSPITLVPKQGNSYADNSAIAAGLLAGDQFELWGEKQGGHYITYLDLPNPCTVNFKYGAALQNSYTYTYAPS